MLDVDGIRGRRDEVVGNVVRQRQMQNVILHMMMLAAAHIFYVDFEDASVVDLDEIVIFDENNSAFDVWIGLEIHAILEIFPAGTAL